MNEKEALVVLNAVQGLGPSRIMALVEAFKSAVNVLKVSFEDLLQIKGFPKKVAENIKSFEVDSFLTGEHNLLKKHAAGVVTIFDQDYPDLLKQIPGAPMVLYVQGVLPKSCDKNIAFVGSRQSSVSGNLIAEKMSYELAGRGFNVVSGLARGIDAAAHRGALNAKAPTFAVLGCGLSHYYPKENQKLHDLIAKNGAVISEYPMSQLPIAAQFPRRNRIISGLSRGVVVVEAAMKSGALITADFALEQGRDVFAVPGRIDSMASKGTNNLIKMGAKLVTSAEDILEDFNGVTMKSVLSSEECVLDKKVEYGDLDEDQKKVVTFISKKPKYFEDILDGVGLDARRASTILFELELKGLIQQEPGKIFTVLE